MRAFNLWFVGGLVCFGVVALGCGGSGTVGECGDGVVEGNEACDDGANNSDTAADACRIDCTAATCGDGVVDMGEECDGANQCDENCVSLAVCGDGIVGGSEECDGGEDCNGENEANPCRFKTTAFRISRLTLSDPGPGILGIANPLINTAILTDEDSDGALDLNLMILASPLTQEAGDAPALRFVTGDCTAPLDETTTCSAAEGAPVTTFALTNEVANDCFVPDNAVIYSTGGSCANPTPDPPLPSSCPLETLTDDMCPPAPGLDFGSLGPGDDGCFHTAATDFTLSLGTLQIPLQGTELAAQYDGNPATGLFGVLRGFLTAEVADNTRVPGSVSTLGGQPVSFLYGLTEILDVGPDGTTPGWWVHVIVEAEAVVWEAGGSCGNGMLDEGEACDPAIAQGQTGACMTLEQCQAMATETCEQATLVNGDPCNPSCSVSVITADDTTSDGCCGLGGAVPGWTDTPLDDPDCENDAAMAISFCSGI